ncbi:hypothetical protein H1C71_024331, partial [Ictidomys tridecemlineatus]
GGPRSRGMKVEQGQEEPQCGRPVHSIIVAVPAVCILLLLILQLLIEIRVVSTARCHYETQKVMRLISLHLGQKVHLIQERRTLVSRTLFKTSVYFACAP